MRLVWEPERQGDIDDRCTVLDEDLLRPFDPAAQEVLVRTQAGGSPELGGEMHGRETSRRGKIGEAYLDGETDDVSHSREQ